MEKYNRESGLCGAKILQRRLATSRSRHVLAVIARLDRAIQHAEMVVIKSMGRGVLDAPPSRGMTE